MKHSETSCPTASPDAGSPEDLDQQAAAFCPKEVQAEILTPAAVLNLIRDDFAIDDMLALDELRIRLNAIAAFPPAGC